MKELATEIPPSLTITSVFLLSRLSLTNYYNQSEIMKYQHVYLTLQYLHVTGLVKSKGDKKVIKTEM